MYLILLFLPLLGSISAGFFGFLLGKRGAAVITTTSIFICFIISLFLFYEVCLSSAVCSIKVYPWFFSEMFDSWWGFYFDSLSVGMSVVICGISFLVHLYSIGYMESDPHLPRFMSYLSIFTFFMLFLVTADNFMQMFFGWEGVGLASYLLISFWFTRLQASKASIKAMLVNRVGDFGLLLGILGLFSIFKTVSFKTIFASVPAYSDYTWIFLNTEFHAYTCISILLFVGAVGKSAQLGLHTWLPDAMEGPTPVSALIHAATMVTAGVFLLARCSMIFEYAPTALTVVSVLGGMTCFFAGTTAIVQNDIKRVIAYSTCSQLGYMVFACGISAYSVGVFHLINHAFFKGLLFLSAGSVIHAVNNEQDMRKMGGLVKILPFTYSMMVVGSLALVGFPFLTGFYSKDLILECGFGNYSIEKTLSEGGYYLGCFSVLLTSYYSFRLLFLTFFNNSYSENVKKSSFLRNEYTNTFKNYVKNAHESGFLMGFPLFLLALSSIFVGFFLKDMMTGLGTNFWKNSIFILPSNVCLIDSEYIPQSVKFIPLFFTFAGLLLSYFVCFTFNKQIFKFKDTFFGRKGYFILSKRWLFDKVYNDFIAVPLLSFGYNVSFKALDKGSFEFLGPYGLVKLITKISKFIPLLQTGMIYHYAVVMLLGYTFTLSIVCLWDILQFYFDSRLFFLYIPAFLIYNNTDETS